MKYVFIIGRNKKLSIREIKSYFIRNNIEFEIYEEKDNALLVETDKKLGDGVISFFGGVISFGEVFLSCTHKKMFEELEKINLYLGEENKLNYTVWEFSPQSSEFLNYLKDRFKSEKLKATYKGLTGQIKSQSGKIEQKPSSKLLDEEYFIFENDGIEHIGKMTQKCNYDNIEKRDMQKPFRRESLAISPRLAKIMINLSEIENEQKLLDSFCGVGTILQEALLQKIKVLGIDRDKNAILAAKENLKWFSFPIEDYSLINADSSKIDIENVDVLVSEPDLGETLKKIPTKKKAEDILKNFEKLMISVINNLKEKISGKIVFSSPYIRIGKKRLACNIEKICEKTGYVKSYEEIAEFRENQIVGRMIYVLEKENNLL
jgi:tRNA G10  N-methylase Trm11